MGIKHVLILAFPTIILHNSGDTYLLVCPSFFYIYPRPTHQKKMYYYIPYRNVIARLH